MVVQPGGHRPTGSPFSRSIERDCRQALLPQSDYSDRMVSPPGHFRPDLPKVTHTISRSVCDQVQHEITPVHVPSPRQGSLGSGCSGPIIGGSGCLCVPSSSSDSQYHKQDSQP